MLSPGFRDGIPAFHPRTSSPAEPAVAWVAARPPRRGMPSSPAVQNPAAPPSMGGISQRKMTSIPEGPASLSMGGGGVQQTKPSFPAGPGGPISWPYSSRELSGPSSIPDSPAVPFLASAGGVTQSKPTFPSSPQGHGVPLLGGAGDSAVSSPMFTPVTGSTSSQSLSANPQLGHVSTPPGQEADMSFGSVTQGGQKEVAELGDGMLPPLGYLRPGFQGGELSTTTSMFEHGDSEREIEGIKYAPMAPYASAEMLSPLSPGSMESVGQVPNLFYLFLTGQLPPGTVSHVQTDYMAGRDHTTQVGYEEYQPVTSNFPQMQAPMDWQKAHS